MSTHGSRNEGRSKPKSIDPKGAGTATGTNAAAIKRMDSYLTTQVAPYLKSSQAFMASLKKIATDQQAEIDDLKKQNGVLATENSKLKNVVSTLEAAANGESTVDREAINAEANKLRAEISQATSDLDAQIKHMITASNGLEARHENLENCMVSKLEIEELRKDVARISTSGASQGTLISQVKMLSGQVTDLRSRLDKVKAPPVDNIVATSAEQATTAAVKAANEEVQNLRNELIAMVAALEGRIAVSSVPSGDDSDGVLVEPDSKDAEDAAKPAVATAKKTPPKRAAKKGGRRK
ncbi:MAG: hypothetical protein CMK92_04730 [Pseudomonas sp.]|nr:hypothetical protein [Pseudomonas sp.]